MLTVARSIRELPNRVYDPVADQVVRKIIDALGAFPTFANRIYAVNEHSKHAHTHDSDHKPNLGTENRVTYTHVPIINPGSQEWSGSFNIEEEDGANSFNFRPLLCPLFYHHPTTASLHEYGQPVELSIECVLNVSSRSVAYEILDLIHFHLDPGQMRAYTDISFDYLIPGPIYSRMYLIYKMLGELPNNAFYDFLVEFSNGNISKIKNVATGKNALVAVRRLSNVPTLVECDMDQPEAVQNENTTTSYQLRFNVRVQFTRPVTLFFYYPIIVNNTLIPETGIEVAPDEAYGSAPDRSPFFAEDHYRQIAAKTNPIKTVHLPWYDNWSPPAKSPVSQLRYFPFLTIAFTLDDVNNPQGETVIDLEQLGDVSLAESVLADIKSVDYDLLTFSGMYHIGVYANNTMVDPENLVLEAKTLLHVKCRDKLKVYRLVLGVSKPKFEAYFKTTRIFVVDINVNNI